jgi:glutaconate CoA-transferase subunit B
VPGGGPKKVYTDLCVWDFDPETETMRVATLHDGVTRDDVVAECGFAVDFSPALHPTQPPSREELRLIREEIDREGLFLGAKIA